MQTRYLVAYDICDPARLRKVYKTLRGYGAHLQFSVFRCDLTDRERVVLGGLLGEIVHHEEDQVMFVRLGPAESHGDEVFETIGRPLAAVRQVLIL